MSTNILKAMRRGAITMALIAIGAITAHSQNQVITVDIQNVPLGKAMEIISQKAGMKVAYSKEFVDTDKIVSVKSTGETLDKVLSQMLGKIGVAYDYQNNSILLYKKGQNATGSGSNNATDGNSFDVSGVVTDIQGEPIIGATVAIVGTNRGMATDLDGQFSLRVKKGDKLRISYVGHAEQNITVKNGSKINVVLKENVTDLEEVVVVAYGTQKKVNLTGAVSMVKGDVLESRPITSVAAGLQGELPGVNVTNTTGQPGAASSITIRGVSTINSSTDPLILIDGVAGGDINLLNPDDIASVSVLKDAASAAIYGARAANGVILITTKTGQSKDKTTFNYSGYVGWQTPTRLPQLVSGREYMTLSNEAMSAAGYSKPYDEDAFAKYDSGNYPNEYSNTDWIDEVYKKSALQTGHNLSVKGGNEKSGYMMSYGYLNQDGLVIGDAFKSRRHNARISANTEVYNRLKLTGKMSFVDFYRQDCGLSGTAGVFRLAQRISPLLPVRWQMEDENGNWVDTDWYSFGAVKNPVNVALNSGSEKRNTRVFNAIGGAELKIIDGLTLGGQYSVNYYSRETNEFNTAMYQYYQDGTPSSENENLRNYVSKSQLNYLTQSLQATLNFNRTFNKVHETSALLGYSQEWETRSTLSASRKNILIDGVEQIVAGTEDITNGGNKYSWALRSYFGRVNYAFDNRYLFEANMRIDGTSRFSKDNRWGYFPSFSAGWNFSRENFMEWASKVLNQGKIRASWGELGNQNVGSDFYPYLTPISREEKTYPIGGKNNVGFVQTKLGNQNIKWETLRMFNIGIDLSFFNNRLNTTFEWYKKNNINALVKPVYPTIVGITGSSNLPYENMGEIENKGWEWWIQWRDRIGEFTYSAAFNISDSKNKIIDLGKSEASLGNYIRREGDPIDAYYGYLNDGLAQINDFEGTNDDGKYINPKFATPVDTKTIVQPGDIKYRDISGPDGKPDGIIDDNDKVVFGDYDPHYIYSFKGYVEWRGIDFSFYFQGVGKANGYLSDEARHCFINDYSIPKVEHLDRWTPTNTNASYPRLYQGQKHNLLFCDYWMEDASYLRLKNIQVGYSLPKNLLKPVRLSKLRVYFSADNLLTFTNYFGAYDPELRTSSGDAYPQVKTFIFGLQATF